MQKLFGKIFPWRIQWKGVLYESLLFLCIYIVWVIFRPAQSASRWLIGSLSVLAPSVTAAILVFRFLIQIPLQSQRAWRFFGAGLACWSVGMGVRAFFEMGGRSQAVTFSVAGLFTFLAYPLLFSALIFYPFENRYAPTRFRFLLDAIVSSGVVAILCWLILARPTPSLNLINLAALVYPISDLILIMILANMFLANPKARRTLFVWGLGLFAFLVSDYIYSLLTPIIGYQSGGLESLGWTAGGLIFGIGVVLMVDSPTKQEGGRTIIFDLGTRIQNILPVTLVLALGWFVLADWRLSGQLSVPGLWASIFLALVLLLRMGVRAGEVELHKYWQLFDGLAEPTFICDASGKILLGNPALARTLGVRDERQLAGKRLVTIFDDETIPADLLQRAARQACSQEVSLRLNNEPYLLSLSPIISEGSKVLIAGAAYDLSDQKHQQEVTQNAFNELQVVYQRLEELNAGLEQKVEERTHTLGEAYKQLEKQNKILQALDQMKSDFVSMVSHELRTPLTSLNGGLELLLDQKGRRTADITTFSLMKNEVQRLTRFVENILNLSAMEAGRIKLHPVALSLATQIEEVRDQFSTGSGAKRIQINFPEDLPFVRADGVVLKSIFNHLIDNALKYAPESPVVVEAFQEQGKVRVQITDAGPGIPEEKRSLLFQRFQRLDAKDSQSVYGYGLGLYLSQKMLQAMHSELAFDAPPEGGARFFFYLKVAR